jgi:hypothetical protein
LGQLRRFGGSVSNRFLTGLPVFLCLAVPCFTQTDQSPSPPSTATPAKTTAAATPTTPPKKVWTNDDFHGSAGVSVVGDKRNQNYHMGALPSADPATVARIRKDLEKLNSQLDDTNQKLAALKAFEAGEPVKDGGQHIDKGLNRIPVDQQIVQCEASKKKLEAQIGDLLDEARTKGIDPGQLR